MSNDTRIAVDVAKAVFEIAISDRPGHVMRRERLPRGQFLAFMARQPRATVIMEACGEIREIEARVKQVERQLEATAEQLPAVEHLRTIPGIGLLIATALVAFIGDIRRFPSGRHFASYLGLTPREYSSGLKRHLGRISKRGDGYLRTLLIHGARSVLVHARKQQPDRLREWANKLAKTHVHNKAAVAVANKLARIVWAVWHHERPFALIAKVA